MTTGQRDDASVEGELLVGLAAAPPQQERTMRWMGILATLGLVALGGASFVLEPKAPETLNMVVTCLTGIVGAVVGIKGALSPASATKSQ